MTLLCYIESAGRAVPHMLPMEAQTPEEARRELISLMREHAQATQGHIYRGEQRLATIRILKDSSPAT